MLLQILHILKKKKKTTGVAAPGLSTRTLRRNTAVSLAVATL